MPALGFIETRGRVGAVEAADAALKAAEVRLITVRKVSGGLVTVIIEGEVAAVQASIEAAKIRARQLHCDAATNVIPGPAEEIHSLIKTIAREEGFKISGNGSKKRTTRKAASRARTTKKM
ncbi:MAG: BMC domain-containing protein [Candidatus Odinarchaeota archaeon]